MKTQKKKRSIFRTMWLMWVKYTRWYENPKNIDAVINIEIFNKQNNLFL